MEALPESSRAGSLALPVRPERILPPEEASRCNPLQLAYIGDTVWDLLVRTSLMQRRLNLRHMHDQAVRLVNATAQAGAMARIESALTDEELLVARRGRNAHPKHSAPHNQSPIAYAEATGFEALLGYLYLSGQTERLLELFRMTEEETHAVSQDEG